MADRSTRVVIFNKLDARLVLVGPVPAEKDPEYGYWKANCYPPSVIEPQSKTIEMQVADYAGGFSGSRLVVKYEIAPGDAGVQFPRASFYVDASYGWTQANYVKTAIDTSAGVNPYYLTYRAATSASNGAWFDNHVEIDGYPVRVEVTIGRVAAHGSW